MKAITVEPKQPGSARFEDIPEPDVAEGSVLVEAIAVGVCWDRRGNRRREIWLGAARRKAPGAGA